jgi:hypothetical protein
MKIRKKFIYLFTLMSIVNCLFAAPVFASVSMTPSIISVVIFTDGPGRSFGYLKKPQGSADTTPIFEAPEETGCFAPAQNIAAALEGADAAKGEYAAEAAESPEAVDAMEAENDESLWYSPDIPMKKEHQQLLWECCKQKGLDYIDMLALISLESNFNEKCSNNRYKGYFQISTSPCGESCTKALNTPNDSAGRRCQYKMGDYLIQLDTGR